MKGQTPLYLADEGGSDNYTIADIKNLTDKLEVLGGTLIKKIAESARSKGVVGSGALISPSNYRTEIIDNEAYKILQIYMLNYYDYVNEGVKGWGSSANAPNSPYQFKSKGMTEDGRKSIRGWIKRKGGITRNVNTKYKMGIELKGKGKVRKSKEDIMVDTAVWLIKKYGIKQTNYMTEAIDSMKGEIKDQIGEAALKDIKIQLITQTK